MNDLFNDPRILKIGSCDHIGRRQGVWYFANSNHTLLAKGKYMNGKRNGLWTWYENGCAKIQTLHYQDDLVGHQNVW